MPPAVLEPAAPASDRPWTLPSDRAVSGNSVDHVMVEYVTGGELVMLP